MRPRGGLTPACVGGAGAKRPILIDLGKLTINTSTTLSSRLYDGNGAVERPRSSAVQFIVDNFECHVRIGER